MPVGPRVVGATHAREVRGARRPVRTTPIALVTRKNWALWHSLAAAPHEEMQLSHGARALFEYFATHGASFFDDLVSGTNLLRSQAETALGELVSAGLVNADSYSRPARAADSQRQEAPARGAPPARRVVRPRRRRPLEPDPQGRHASNDAEALEQVAESCCAATASCSASVLEREADWLPPWHALLRVFRRLEAQGKIRGGRFVAGMSGEQYALPDAVSVDARDPQAGSEGRFRVAERRRSAESHGHRHAGRARAGARPTIACCIATVCRWRCTPAGSPSSSCRWSRRRSGKRGRRWCAGTCSRAARAPPRRAANDQRTKRTDSRSAAVTFCAISSWTATDPVFGRS